MQGCKTVVAIRKRTAMERDVSVFNSNAQTKETVVGKGVASQQRSLQHPQIEEEGPRGDVRGAHRPHGSFISHQNG